MTAGPGNVATYVAMRFHEETKHAERRVCGRAAPDPDNRPVPFKTYAPLSRMPTLPALPDSTVPALRALTCGPVDLAAPRTPDGCELLHLCRYANGLLGPARAGRPAPCTGALHHVELYLVCRDLAGLPAGVYHYDVGADAFQPLRAGDYRAALVAASGTEEAVRAAPAVVVCTSQPWRNGWKYGERSYRHVFWDAGTVLANLTAVAAARGLPARVVLGFVDAEVSRVLGLDPFREPVVGLVPVGSGASAPPPVSVGPLHRLAAPVSTAEAVLPASRRMHAASSLELAEEVTEWRAGGRCEGRRGAGPAALAPSPPIEAVIRRRRSARAFTAAGISREELAILLRVASTPVGTDYGGGCVTPYLAVHAVEHLAPGTYAVPDGAKLVPLRHGPVRAAAAAAALGQRPAGTSAVNLYLLADLPAVLSRLGNRGYRAAQLTGGLLAGRLYLAAYALGRGATGLTFYDDQLIDLLMPAGGDRSVMFLLAVGTPPPAAVPA